jgi:hypothetical protein
MRLRWSADKFLFTFLFLILLTPGGARAQSLPGGLVTSDVGAVGGAVGSAGVVGASIAVTGAGADIWGTADAFRFVYLPLTGDGTVVARVTSVQRVADWTKAGVMMRESLSAGSPQAYMLVSANKGIAFQRRVSANGASTSTGAGSGYMPGYVRMTRIGSSFTASYSTDGSAWTTMGVETISMASTIYVGLAVTSHADGALATATFENVGVTGPQPSGGGGGGAGGGGGGGETVETIVFFRHGEKPAGGYGQLTCQGLQRALALPSVLIGRYGRPQQLFAPNPLPKVNDPAGAFDYVRALAAIEPTAIVLGLPVNAEYGHTDVAGLRAALLDSALGSSTVFVSWEHLRLVEVVQGIMDTFQSGVTVPAWTSGDYDSLYVVRLRNVGGTVTATFERDVQGLNNLPTTCP